MKIVLHTQQLKNVLQHVSRFVSTKPQLPILSSVAIETVDNTVSFSATDLQVGIQERIDAQVENQGHCVVPSKVLLDLINSIQEDEVELLLDQLTLSVKTKKTQVELSCFPFDDFPPFPKPEGTTIKIPSSLLLESAQSVLFAASLDETRPILTTAFFSLGEISKIVTTDGYRLALLEMKTPGLDTHTMLLPAKAVLEVCRIVTQQPTELVEIQLSEGLKQAFFTTKDTHVVLRVLDGEYPNYSSIVPTTFSLRVVASKSELEGMIKTALLFTKDSSGIIKFSIENEILNVSASSSSVGKYQGQITVKNESEGHNSIAFNGRFILDFLQKIKDEKVVFQMTESLKPGVFYPETMEQLRYIVMPFRLTE